MSGHPWFSRWRSLRVAGAAFVTGAGAGARADALPAATLQPPAEVWAGEVFPVAFQIEVPADELHAVNSGVDWAVPALVVGPWSPVEKHPAGAGVLLQTQALARAGAPGDVILPGAHLPLTLRNGTTRFGNYVRPNLQDAVASSGDRTLHVRALPPAPASAGRFFGAVGNFSLAGKVVPGRVRAGHPVTWTLQLTGTGNWPDVAALPAPALPAGTRPLPPRVERKLAADNPFAGSLLEEHVLVPERAGPLTLGPVHLAYFDPVAGRYAALDLPAQVIAVEPNPDAPAASADWKLTAPEAAAATVAGPPPPPAPARILRDPILRSGHAAVPASAASVRAQLLLPVVLLFLFWAALAARRAWERDPQRLRRAERRRALRLLAAIEQNPDGPARGHLVWQWQQAVIRVWNFSQAVPRPEHFGENSPWTALWREANAAIYAAHPALPPDWIARARAATQARRPPRFPLHSLLRPAHWWLAAVALCLVRPAAHRAAPLDTYRAGDFAAFETAARAAVRRDPLDFAARHNLALALAQQGRWPEAAGQAVAAYVQNPGDEAVRWDLAVIAGQVHLGTPEIVPVVRGEPLGRWSALAGPATWQQLAPGAAWCGALGAGLALWSRFRRRRGAASLLGRILLGLGLLLGAGSALALGTFGHLLPADAAYVWRATTLRSVPTEAGDRAGSSSLAAGSLLRVDEFFLTWRHVELPNGQTGWVRNSDLVPLWQ